MALPIRLVNICRSRVGSVIIRDACSDPEFKLQIFRNRSRLKRRKNVMKHRVPRRRFHGFNRQFSRFDTRQIQQVIQQAMQVIAVAQDALQM